MPSLAVKIYFSIESFEILEKLKLFDKNGKELSRSKKVNLLVQDQLKYMDKDNISRREVIKFFEDSLNTLKFQSLHADCCDNKTIEKNLERVKKKFHEIKDDLTTQGMDFQNHGFVDGLNFRRGL